MKDKGRMVVSIIFFCLLFSIGIGYATYTRQTTVGGTATFYRNGEVTITSAILTDYKNLQNPNNPVVNDKNISFDLNFYVARTQEALNDEYYATYQITISNDSVFDYKFRAADFTPSLNTQNEEDIEVSYYLEGIEVDENIPSKSTKTFYLTINMVPNNAGNFNISGETDVEVEQEEITGTIIGSIPKNTTGNLVDNQVIPIVATIINTYKENKEYNIIVTNDNFELVDINGNYLNSFTINANSEDEKTVYLKIKNGARFASERQNLNIFLSVPGGETSSMGLVQVTVPRDATLVDVTPPTVSNVIGTKQNNQGEVIVTFNASDDFGIHGFTIEVYKDNNLIDTKTAGPDVRSYTITNLEDGNYKFKVIAEDTSGLTASSESNTTEYRWIMRVVINISQGGPNGTYTTIYGQNYTTTITANNNRNLPTALTITMGGNNVANNGYNYNTRTGSLTVYNVTDDLNISGDTTGGTCLIKGTKVLLANNTYKNIEDIKYDDLLMVWNYETGKLTKEYPIWIEKEKKSNSYIKVTFSDNSTIGIVGSHAFFSRDYNEFISSKDSKKFHIGSKIVKIDNGILKEVSITKIEKIYDKTEYYFVASTRYWNIITNDFITTDAYTDITNLYPFNKNITWSNNRNIIKIDYELVKDILPYYMFKGFRAEELGVLFNNNKNDINGIKNYIQELIISDHMLKEPIIFNNKRYWMVTNSIDKILNKKDHLVEEGSYYKLPKGKWYSTSENKIYEGNSLVQVWTGMHFEKVL